uniref:Uncharacterized protein n=1 Tax=Anthurium amnicola TaxID=1678845 RepID=A0A1D1XL07_9ARAE
MRRERTFSAHASHPRTPLLHAGQRDRLPLARGIRLLIAARLFPSSSDQLKPTPSPCTLLPQLRPPPPPPTSARLLTCCALHPALCREQLTRCHGGGDVVRRRHPGEGGSVRAGPGPGLPHPLRLLHTLLR